ncbi:MAG: hypothetical protein ACRDZX_01990 [Acidimicrobiales bacterium]
MAANLRLGVAATKAPWSAALRSYVRDHGQGVEAEVVMDRAGLRRAVPRIDVLVLDDVMRTFSVVDVARAHDGGVHVVGLFDPATGMGRQYLTALGADQVVPASASPAELMALISQLAPRRPGRADPPDWGLWARPTSASPAPKRGRGHISTWTKVSGGPGLTEAVVAAAEHLARRGRVIVVEAEEAAPVMASRLLRSPELGLAWALARARQGARALPGALSGARGDGTVPLGHFDVLCGPPAAAAPIAAAHLDRLLSEAVNCYDHVLLETGWLLGVPAGGERFSATRLALQRAATVVVMAAADPEGAARLVQWRAAALAAGVSVPCWAAFGRARRSRYEQGHLQSLVEANTGRHPFSGIRFLPEDPTVARARWNAEIAWKGPWLVAVKELAASSVLSAAQLSPAQIDLREPAPSSGAPNGAGSAVTGGEGRGQATGALA